MERTKPGRARINEALSAYLRERALDDISVVDLCSHAGVSRSTFYAHYSNVDDVYQELVRELVAATSPIRPQLRCADCGKEPTKQPLCKLIRTGGKYQFLAKEARFIPTLLEICAAEFNGSTANVYESVCGTDEELAFALFCFQMTGCIGTAKTMPDSTDWSRVRPTIDAFIRGGLNAVRNLNR